MNETKRCTKCNNRLTLDHFGARKKSKDGLSYWCKHCQNDYGRTYYVKHRETIKLNAIRYINKHRFEVWVRHTLDCHRRSGYIVNINKAELIELAKRTIYCPICGTELKWGFKDRGNGGRTNSPSLDRMNNETQLSIDNVWIVCRRCNGMMQDLDKHSVYLWAKKYISKYEEMFGV